MAAGPATAESSMEARIARLESDVGHLRSDVTEIKVDVRSLRDRMDAMGVQLTAKIESSSAQLNAKLDHFADQTNNRFDDVYRKFDDLKASIAGIKTWTLTMHIALAAALFGTMARGFGWI